MLVPITQPKNPHNISIGKRRYTRLDSAILLKHNRIINSITEKTAAIDIPLIKRLEDNKIHEETDPKKAEIPDATNTKINKYSFCIETFSIINELIDNTATKANNPMNNDIKILFKTTLSCLNFFAFLSE